MKKTPNSRRLVAQQGLAALLAIAFSACASSPATLKMSTDDKASMDVSDASVVILSLTDKRERNSEMTDMSGRPMADADVMSWLEQGFAKEGLMVAGNELSAIPGQCTVKIELRRAFVSTNGAAKSANIVLSVSMGDDGDAVLIRGLDSSMNWAGTNGESNAALSRALKDAAEKIREKCPA